MKNQLIFLFVFEIILFFSSCQNHSYLVEENFDKNELIWKKVKSKNDTIESESYTINHPSCFPKGSQLLGEIYDSKWIFYEFDSIRVYIEKSDTSLNAFFELGFLQGNYFFKDSCLLVSTDKVLSEFNEWTGYNIFLTNTVEWRHKKFPRNNHNDYRTFKFDYRIENQIFPNPTNFEISITNTKYRFSKGPKDLRYFLKNVDYIEFSFSGFQI